MTLREIELWLLGQSDAREWFFQTVAWQTTHLLNIQLGRGKKIRMDQLLPRKKPKRDEDDEMPAEPIELPPELSSPKERMEAVKARVRAKQERDEQEAFARSREGRKLKRFFEGW